MNVREKVGMDSKIGTVIFTILAIFLIKIGMERSISYKNKPQDKQSQSRNFISSNSDAKVSLR